VTAPGLTSSTNPPKSCDLCENTNCKARKGSSAVCRNWSNSQFLCWQSPCSTTKQHPISSSGKAVRLDSPAVHFFFRAETAQGFECPCTHAFWQGRQRIWLTRYLQFLYLKMKRSGPTGHYRSRRSRRKKLLSPEHVAVLVTFPMIALPVVGLPLLDLIGPPFALLLQRRRNQKRSNKVKLSVKRPNSLAE
jgi:hypothetical protein